MPKFLEINPIVPVKDVLVSADFFEKVLGFDVEYKAEHFGLVRRDNAGLRLLRAGDKVGQQACYIVVDDVDALYAELKPELDKLPGRRVRPPFDQDYGMRELHVVDLDKLLIFFGQPIG